MGISIYLAIPLLIGGINLAVADSQKLVRPSPTPESVAPNRFKLEVKLKALRSDQGQILALLFSSKNGFPGKAETAVRNLKIPVNKENNDFLFQDLGPGEYAVTVVHDENGNGKLDTNWIGIPKEGIGVSRDAKMRFGPPSFEDAKMRIEQDTKSEIQMRYR